MQNYLSLIYQNNFIPAIKKPTRVTRKTSTIINHVFTNSFVNTNFKTIIFRTDISDHFPVCFLQPRSTLREKKTKVHILLKQSSIITQSKCSNRNYIKPTGMISEAIKIRMMNTISFYFSLLLYMISIFQK